MNRDREVTIGIVGAGRLGASLAAAMDTAGYSIKMVSRRRLPVAELVAERIEGVTATDDPQAVADATEVVFVTSSDSVIEELAKAIIFRPEQAVLHCSGATPVSALDNALSDGAVTGGIHPLQTFPNEFGQDRFKGVTFGVEASDGRLLQWLERLVQDLGGTPILITEEVRSAYHASAVMACGLVAGLVGLAADMWDQLGQTRDTALQALVPLLMSTAAQISTMGIPEGITGPYVRGDLDVVRKHLGATAKAGPEVLRGYTALALAQLPIAAEQGGVSHERRAEIEQLLRATLALAE